MTGPEHYREAERLLSAASYTHGPGRDPVHPEAAAHHVAMAQVHATLALTAATAMQAAVDGSEPGMAPREFEEWYRAAGVQPKGGGQ
ncbi:hypothetical protein [Streptomyces sp. BE230]|uniref:hypothetical protein n=1 Tax=Streptomyces sp. BE230 TaxID=3002526 RepID=UPI002ED3DE95|nr:hypothetical protein [Streptomyces sp. BE230]